MQQNIISPMRFRLQKPPYIQYTAVPQFSPAKVQSLQAAISTRRTRAKPYVEPDVVRPLEISDRVIAIPQDEELAGWCFSGSKTASDSSPKRPRGPIGSPTREPRQKPTVYSPASLAKQFRRFDKKVKELQATRGRAGADEKTEVEELDGTGELI